MVSDPSHILYILTGVCALTVFLEHHSSLCHDAGYIGVQCRSFVTVFAIRWGQIQRVWVLDVGCVVDQFAGFLSSNELPPPHTHILSTALKMSRQRWVPGRLTTPSAGPLTCGRAWRPCASRPFHTAPWRRAGVTWTSPSSSLRAFMATAHPSTGRGDSLPTPISQARALEGTRTLTPMSPGPWGTPTTMVSGDTLTPIRSWNNEKEKKKAEDAAEVVNDGKEVRRRYLAIHWRTQWECRHNGDWIQMMARGMLVRAPQHSRDVMQEGCSSTKSVEASLIRLCSVKTHHAYLSSFPRLEKKKSQQNKLLGWWDWELGYFKI